eukprot:8742462-Karenia_brevis.AAC.1
MVATESDEANRLSGPCTELKAKARGQCSQLILSRQGSSSSSSSSDEWERRQNNDQSVPPLNHVCHKQTRSILVSGC